MKYVFQQVYQSVKQVLKKPTYIFIFLLLASLFFGVFILLPVITTPGNSIAFQLSIFRARDFLLMITLALLVGLNFSMNIYAWRQQRQRALFTQSAAAASGAAAGVGGTFASVVGSATCASCLSSLFGILGLGFGATAFVLKYQTFFFLGAAALVLLSLYFTARKVGKSCDSCYVGKNDTDGSR